MCSFLQYIKSIPFICLEIKIWEKTTTKPLDIAEELNLHFSSMGERVASEIPASDIDPETYLTQMAKMAKFYQQFRREGIS